MARYQGDGNYNISITNHELGWLATVEFPDTSKATQHCATHDQAVRWIQAVVGQEFERAYYRKATVRLDHPTNVER